MQNGVRCDIASARAADPQYDCFHPLIVLGGFQGVDDILRGRLAVALFNNDVWPRMIGPSTAITAIRVALSSGSALSL